LPDQKAAAYRALCLGTLLMRANLEDKLRTGNVTPLPSAQPASMLWEPVKSWLERYSVSAFLSPKEEDLLRKSVGSWSLQELVNSGWRAECLGVVLWALGEILNMPSYDTQFSAPDLLQRLPMARQPDEFVGRAKLRSSTDISKARDLAELWNWRARTTRVQKSQVNLPPGMTFQQIISNSARQAHKAGMIASPIDNDFPLHGKSFGKLSDEEYENSSSICQERHFALNWLTGHSEDWDDTPTET